MDHLSAPGRMAYVAHADGAGGCFFCEAWPDAGADADARRLVLARGRYSFVILNRFPYNTGHLMIATARHDGDLARVAPDAAAEAWGWLARAKRLLEREYRPDGFNVGINQGRAGGAGVADHLHIHLVPRWAGDTNFMTVCGDVRVTPEAPEATFRRLRPLFDAPEATP